MIINNNLCTEMYTELDETKIISKLSFSQEDFRDWCHTTNHVATLSYKRRLLGEDELDEFKIPTALKDMCIPRKISYELGEDWKQLRGKSYDEYTSNLTKYGMDKAKLLDAVKYNRISRGIAGSRKAQDKGYTTLDVPSAECTLSTVENRIADLSKGYDKARVLVGTQHYVPVDFNQNFMEDEFYTQKPEAMYLKWFADALNNLAK